MRELLEHMHTRLASVVDGGETDAICRALCMELLGISQADYYLKGRIAVTDSMMARLDNALERICAGEPLQYVLGNAPFSGLDFRVDGRVLIPRPETAELVDWILQDYSDERLELLDIGTGSGCIAISLSSRRRGWNVSACDISRDALDVAVENNRSNGTGVHFFQTDILSSQCTCRNLDVIVSNPPYIAESERREMEHTVLDYEPESALFVPDDDPLKFYRAIARFGKSALRQGGALFFEINPLFAVEMVGMLESMGYSQTEVRCDIFGKKRMLKTRIEIL